MISITYISTAEAPFNPSSLDELLLASRERNHRNGITGMLLYAGGHFIQTLEGAHEVVDATFARIEQDARHRSVYVALREQLATRVFPDWSMGFETLTADEASALLPGFNTYLEGKPISAEDAKALGRAGVFHRVFRDRMR
jgi:stress-induced morphogen